MSFERKQTFVEDEFILAPDLEEEFDNIADQLNTLFQAGRVTAAEQNLGVLVEDVTGSEESITVSVPSLLIVFATADLEGPGGRIIFNVDGVDQGAEMQTLTGTGSIRATVAQNYCISLDAGAHTIKMRKQVAFAGTNKAKSPGTGYTYLVIPAP